MLLLAVEAINALHLPWESAWAAMKPRKRARAGECSRLPGRLGHGAGVPGAAPGKFPGVSGVGGKVSGLGLIRVAITGGVMGWLVAPTPKIRHDGVRRVADGRLHLRAVVGPGLPVLTHFGIGIEGEGAGEGRVGVGFQCSCP